VVESGVTGKVFSVDAHVAFAPRGGKVGDSLMYDRMMHSDSLTILYAGRMFAEVSGAELSHANFCNARGIL
jgi:hypothetical protein